ncbi:hypothetical protein A0H81_03888 [Grifola frondosa]|uniref:DUF6534 domain-containing protein n=1 Tax=Grifola frondosa TaxID=5627 RepID=A0A1C7MM38_GRIFR|nr:hypothetical protein A0H81_03888 [Grifola frondosa]
MGARFPHLLGCYHMHGKHLSYRQNRQIYWLGNADPLRASSWAFPCWVYGSLVLALSVTSILSASLWRTKTGLNYLDKTLKHIISITWESAALPAACMVVSGVLYSGIDSSEIRHLDLFFIIITAKVYTLGLLRTLNKRTQLRERLHSNDLGRHSLSDCQWDAQAPAPPTVRECVAPNESMVSPAGGVGAGLGNSLPSVAARLGERSDDIIFTAPDWTAMDSAAGAKSNV